MHGIIQHYLPMIVLELHDTGEGIIILITDPGITLNRYDIILCTETSERFFVNELHYINDLFEDFIYINIIPISTNQQAVNGLINVNTELKLLAHAFKE